MVAHVTQKYSLMQTQINRLCDMTAGLPEEIGHVCVGTVDRTKPGQQSHERDANHTNTTD